MAECPLNGRENPECRHCSIEIYPTRGSKILTGQEIRFNRIIGERCNTHGRAMVADLDCCPLNDLVPPRDYKKNPETELEWSRRHGGL